MSDTTSGDLLTLTARIVSAHVARSKVEVDALPALIQSVYGSLAKAGAPEPEAPQQEPAVPIKRSIQQEYLVCLEDGAKMKMLKRYLMKRYGLTPDAYRRKWGLPADYPMVAPAYAEKRSALARDIGLGRKPRSLAQELVQADIAETEEAMAAPDEDGDAAPDVATDGAAEMASDAAASPGKPKRGRRKATRGDAEASQD